MTHPSTTADSLAQLVADHLSLAGALAHHAHLECREHMDLEELIAIANQGLVEAATRWNPDGASFATFAYYRVHGALIDAMRREAPLPRRVARRWRAGESVREFWRTSGQRTFRNASGEPVDAEQPPPDELVHARRVYDRLRDAVRELPGRERRLLEKHYFEDTTMCKAGETIGLSKSRASRLHSRALGRLRAVMEPAP